MSSISLDNSIYPQFFLDTLDYQPTGSAEKNRESVLNFLYLAKFFATNANLAIKEFKRGRIKAFDPLVRDRCCQIHALQILELFQDPSVRQEIDEVEEKIVKVLKEINKRACKVPVLKEARSFSRFVKDFNISIELSKKTQLLFDAYMLTMATTLSQPRHIEYQKLQSKLSGNLNIDMIKLIVSLARTAISESSTRYIQRLAALLDPENRRLLQSRLSVIKSFVLQIDKCSQSTPLTTTCMFYNMQTVLLKAKEDRSLLLIKESRMDTAPSKGLYFRSEDPGGPFLPISTKELKGDEAVLVFKGEIGEGVTQEQLIEQITTATLENTVLAYITNIEQFVVDNDLSLLDPMARDEIAAYTEKAKIYSQQAFKSILHAYPSRVESERVL